MEKNKKPTLKDEFIERFGKSQEMAEYRFEEFLEDIFKFFEPYLKKTKSKETIAIDIALVKEFNELWPQEKLNTGKHGRCSQSELIASFAWFFKVHPTFTDWNIILRAAANYTGERAADNWNYTKRSKYFIRKQLPDKSFTSELSEYYERILNGVEENFQERHKGFDVKIY